MAELIVDSIVPRVQLILNAAQTNVSIPFSFLTNTGLAIYIDGVLKTLTTHYTVNGAGTDGPYSVDLVTPAVGGEVFTAVRTTDSKRVTNFGDSGEWTAANVNKELNRLTMVDQELKDRFDRSIKLAESDPTADLTLPILSTVEGKYLAVVGGAVVGVNGTTDTPISIVMTPVVSASSLALGRTALGLGTMATETASDYETRADAEAAYATFETATHAEATFETIANAAEKYAEKSDVVGKNKIINGDMTIDQRRGGAPFSASAGVTVYGPDRFLLYQTANAVTGQRVTTGRSDFPYALKVTGSTGNTLSEIGQRIEAANCVGLSGGSVCVSFMASRSSSANVSVVLAYPNAQDNWSSSTVIEEKVISVTNEMTSFSLVFDNLPPQVANGLTLVFKNASGLDLGVEFAVTGVQLEVGSVKTPFERRNFGYELSLCQRYFERIAYSSNRVVLGAVKTAPLLNWQSTGIYWRTRKRGTSGTVSMSGCYRLTGAYGAYNPTATAITTPSFASDNSHMVHIIDVGTPSTTNICGYYFSSVEVDCEL